MTAIGHDNRTRAILENLAKRHTHQVVKEAVPEQILARMAALEAETERQRAELDALKEAVNNNAVEVLKSLSGIKIVKEVAA